MIRVETTQGVAEIALDRADKHNALTPAMLDELIEAIERADADESARAILIRGEGESFCAGFDLKMCAEEAGVLEALLRGLSSSVRAMRRTHKPVVLCAHGASIAGGCALLGGADVVVTESSAKLGYPVVAIGISPAVTAPTFTRAIGLGPARERLLEPRIFSGVEAYALGLAHALSSDAEGCLQEAREIARTAASRPTDAMRATKQWLNNSDGTNHDEEFERALNASLAILGNEDERHALASMWGANRT